MKDDLNRKAEEQVPLPDLVTNGYYLLGKDWLEAAKAWKAQGLRTPPVMITVANRTETAARIKYAFDHKKILLDELCDPERTLHIDSKVLDMAEAQEEPVALNGERSRRGRSDDDEPVQNLPRKNWPNSCASKWIQSASRQTWRADSKSHLRRHAVRGLGR